jgi:calcineurin-binding protein cabin-1
MYLQLTEAKWSGLVEKTADILKAIDMPYEQRIIVRINSSMSSVSGFAKEDSSVPGKGQQSHERCSTRAGRIGSQKIWKNKGGSGKDADAIFHSLEQFIPKEMSSNKEIDYSGEIPDVSWYTPELEASDVEEFIGSIPEYCNASELASLLLEEIADLELPFGDYFIKLPELEQATRQWHRDRTPRCHLYLAEVCFDLGTHPGNEMRRGEFLSNSNYHICMFQADFLSHGGTSLDITSHWARFYWICGSLSLSEGDKERAQADFNHAISHMRESIFLPNCKNEKWLTVERITCEVYSIQLDNLLRDHNGGVEKLSYSQRVNVLSPLLLSNKVVKRDPDAVAKEICALDLLISACEKEETLNLKVYLDSNKRKLQLLTSLAGLNKAVPEDSEIKEISNSNQFEQILRVIQDISKSTGLVKSTKPDVS